MKNHSTTNTYSTSYGTRLTRSELENLIRKAKAKKLDCQLMEFGYNFCEKTGKNRNAGEPLDCAHIVSVKVALETGRAELCFDTNNIIILCRSEHRKHDNTYLGSKNDL